MFPGEREHDKKKKKYPCSISLAPGLTALGLVYMSFFFFPYQLLIWSEM